MTESKSSTSTSLLSQQLRPIRIGCLGGGQLGRMMGLEAPRLNIEMIYLDPNGIHCPAGEIVPNDRMIQGPLQNEVSIQQLAGISNNNMVDVLTVEIEHVNVAALKVLEEQYHVNVQPSSRVIGIIQDKYEQKQRFYDHQIPVPKFVNCSSYHNIINDVVPALGYPFMLKIRTGGYDGRGNAVVRTEEDIISAIQSLVPHVSTEDITNYPSHYVLPLYAEGWIDFYCEIGVMVVRSSSRKITGSGSGSNTGTWESVKPITECYPAVDAIQQNSICRVVISPSQQISKKVRIRAEQMAIQAIDTFGDGASGVFGVELFIVKKKKTNDHDKNTDNNDEDDDDDFEILLNEVAPRPHNTGHITQASHNVNQFENHLRAICGWNLGNTNMVVNIAAMVNILGQENDNDTDTDNNDNAETSTTTTVTSIDNALACMNDPNLSSSSNGAHTTVHWYGKKECRKGRKMGHINLTAKCIEEIIKPLHILLQLEKIAPSILPSILQKMNSNEVTTTTASSSDDTTNNNNGVVVGVIMGSHSDLPTMQDAIQILQQFGVRYEVDIVSAHRTPLKLLQYGSTASTRGLNVIIAGAGGAAHLPGMIASLTTLPVIGVPIKTSTLSGVDSLYSIVQMPKGIPVATVAIGNATNAGLLAVRILACTNPTLTKQMEIYQKNMTQSVNETSTKLLELGSEEYLKQMDNTSKSVNV